MQHSFNLQQLVWKICRIFFFQFVATLFCLQQLYFICRNVFIYMQQLYFICSNLLICSTSLKGHRTMAFNVAVAWKVVRIPNFTPLVPKMKQSNVPVYSEETSVSGRLQNRGISDRNRQSSLWVWIVLLHSLTRSFTHSLWETTPMTLCITG